MGRFAFREMVSCVLVFLLLFPVSMFAADSNAAMLYINGAAMGERRSRSPSLCGNFFR